MFTNYFKTALDTLLIFSSIALLWSGPAKADGFWVPDARQYKNEGATVVTLESIGCFSLDKNQAPAGLVIARRLPDKPTDWLLEIFEPKSIWSKNFLDPWDEDNGGVLPMGRSGRTVDPRGLGFDKVGEAVAPLTKRLTRHACTYIISEDRKGSRFIPPLDPGFVRNCYEIDALAEGAQKGNAYFTFYQDCSAVLGCQPLKGYNYGYEFNRDLPPYTSNTDLKNCDTLHNRNYAGTKIAQPEQESVKIKRWEDARKKISTDEFPFYASFPDNGYLASSGVNRNTPEYILLTSAEIFISPDHERAQIITQRRKRMGIVIQTFPLVLESKRIVEGEVLGWNFIPENDEDVKLGAPSQVEVFTFKVSDVPDGGMELQFNVRGGIDADRM